MRSAILFLLLLQLCLAAVSQVKQLTTKVDRSCFYEVCKKKISTKLTTGDARRSIDAIFDYWEKSDYSDKRWFAYILGTAYRETVGKMVPVREALCDTDECSIKAVTAYIDKKNSCSKKKRKNYAIPDSKGRSYFGRGFVQITHKYNYEQVGRKLGWGNDLVEHPDKALEIEKAVVILIEGCAQGLFTNKGWKLADFFNATTDWIGARKIVNPGSFRAQITAKHSQDFYDCLTN